MENDTQKSTEEIIEFSDSSVSYQQPVIDENELVDSIDDTGNTRLYVLNKIISTWEKQHNSDIELRKNVARYVLRLLAIETVAVTVIFILTGMHWLTYEEWTFRVFLGSAYAQIIGVVFVMVKYLFSKDSQVALDDADKLIDKINNKN